MEPPSSTDHYPLYITKVRQALLPLCIPSNTTEEEADTNDTDVWARRTQIVLDTIQQTRQQLQSLDFHRIDTTTTTTTTDQSSPSGWEDDLCTMEQLLLDLHRIMDEYHSWTADHSPDKDDDETPKAFIQVQK